MVTVEAQGSRASNGEAQLIPAVVLKEENGFLKLYALHFEGVPINMTVPVEAVKIVVQPTAVEKQALKYSIAHESH